MPPIPSGVSTLWPGPATKPSSDIEILNRSFAMTGLPRNRSMIRVAPVALPMAAVRGAEGEPTMTVMLIYGDADMFRPEHIVEFYHLLGGGLKDAGWQRENMSKNRLAILPDLTHYEMGVAPAMGYSALPFLDGKSGARSWAEEVQ